MVPLFMSQAKKTGSGISASGQELQKKFMTFTGISFYPYLKVADRLFEENII